MTLSSNAAESPAFAAPLHATPPREEVLILPGAAPAPKPRPAPANWRGCGYRRAWTASHGVRAEPVRTPPVT
jgi:hypothetical protein